MAEKISPVSVDPTARTDENMPIKSRIMVFGFDEFTIVLKTSPLMISVNDKKNPNPPQSLRERPIH